MNMINFCDHLYDESTDGYIQILKIENDNVNRGKSIKIYNKNNTNLRELVEVFHDNKDVSVSPNTMYLPRRSVENIRQFRALYQDIDCNKLGLEKTETVYIIWNMYIEGKIPKPTMVVDSGRGLHLYWRIKNAPYQALYAWQELQDYIYYQLKHIGADKQSTDSARVLRLPGTINSKNQIDCKVLLIDNTLEYSMYELMEKYPNTKPKNKKPRKINKLCNKVISNRFFNSYSLHYTRAEDILKLCKLRNYNLTNHRNMVLHCYAYWMGIYIRDSQELENEVFKLNNLFTEPLKESEVKAILRCIPKAIEKFIAYEQGIRNGELKRVSKGMMDKGGYWYKNETLIERLGIAEKEQKHLKTIIDINEKYHRNNIRRRNKRRNDYGLTNKQQEIYDLRLQVVNLKNKGISIRNIAKQVCKSKGSIENLLSI